MTLGKFYSKGLGVKKNPVAAYTLMRIAAAYGFRHWRQSLAMFIAQKGLSEEQIKLAQHNLMVWQLKHQNALPAEAPEFLRS